MNRENWRTVNDGRFPDDSPVWTPFPSRDMTADTPRETWPWMAARVELQGDEHEWVLTIEAPDVAELEDGTPAPEGTPAGDLWHPQAFRTADEIQPRAEGVQAQVETEAEIEP